MKILGKNGAKTKAWSKLGQIKQSRSQGLFLVEGKGPLDVFAGFPELCEAYVIREGIPVPFGFPEDRIYQAQSESFARISQVENSPGICGIAKIRAAQRPIGDRVLVLDGLQEPGNVGTLLRSAWAFGFYDVWCVDGVYPFHPKVVRAAAGAHFFLQFHDQRPDFDVVDRWWVGDIAGELLPNHFSGRLGLCLTNESRGLEASSFASDLDASAVRIPMVTDCESLNVGVAGSILMQAMSKQC